jgi:hypothetical protein
MHMTIEPITKRVWCDSDEEYQDTHELIGFEVRANDGTLIGSGETRDAALSAAQEFILLPTRRTASAV